MCVRRGRSHQSRNEVGEEEGGEGLARCCCCDGACCSGKLLGSCWEGAAAAAPAAAAGTGAALEPEDVVRFVVVSKLNILTFEPTVRVRPLFEAVGTYVPPPWMGPVGGDTS
jgi:hypothetical protein